MPRLWHLLAALLPLQAALGSAIHERQAVDVADKAGNKLGAIASESSECTKIGISMLKKGGNAADAMVGTVFCVGTIGMFVACLFAHMILMLTGEFIQGGGFMLIRSASGGYEFVDFRETAPAAAFTDMYNNDTDLSLYGGLASGVPGEVAGLWYLHSKYGKLPWATIMAPAINYAKNGFVVSPDLVRYMASAVGTGNNFLVNDPTWAIDFAPNGTQVKLGDIMYRKRYAATLERIANEGPSAFYTGAIAETTIAALQASNGTMTLEDLANYTVALRTPAQITYRDFKITSCNAPSGGEVALSVMKTIEGYKQVGTPSFINMTTHHIVEAMRFAYGERTNLGDPAFVPGLSSYVDDMLAAKTANQIRGKITTYSHMNISYYDPSGIESLETPGTSHIVAADKSGMSVSLTTTINLLFGSQLMVPETGIIMNDEMNDFSIPGATNAFGYQPSVANYIKPGKRPLSSMSPTIVEHLDTGKFYMATGAAGGSRIITATMQNLWHVLDQNMTIYAALAEPRFHDQLSPNWVTFEYAFNNQTTAFMASRNHTVKWVAPGLSTAQGLRMLPNGTFEAAGEPRQANSLGAVV